MPRRVKLVTVEQRELKALVKAAEKAAELLFKYGAGRKVRAGDAGKRAQALDRAVGDLAVP